MIDFICSRKDCAGIEDETRCRVLASAPKDLAKCPFYKSREQNRRELKECRERIATLPAEQQNHINDVYYRLCSGMIHITRGGDSE